jgi:uncharacterized protein involved in outer membrane biogenesis
MPRGLRWLLVGVAATVVLVVLVLALLPAFIDVNRYYRSRAIAEVEARLAREITLDRLSLSFLPSPTLGLEALVIGERGAPAEGPIPPGERFVTLDRLDLKLRFLPLLRGRVEVSRLVLDRPQIMVERDAKGNLSVADLIGGPGAAPPAGPQAGRPAGGPSPLAALLVERIEVRRGSLTFRDRAVVPGREVTTTVNDLAATLDDVSLDRPIRADVKATFLSRTPQNVALAGTLGPLGPQVDFLAGAADLSLKATDLDLDQVAAYVGARAGAPKPTRPGSAAEALSLGGTGGLTAAVKGPLGAPTLDATIDLTPATVAYAGALSKKAGVPLVLTVKTTQVQAGQATPVVEIDPLTLRLHTLTLTARGRVANPTNPVVDLTVKSDEARLSGWGEVVPALAGASLGGRAVLEATVRGRLLEPNALDVAGTVRLTGLEVRHASLPEPLSEGEATLRFAGKRASLEPFRAKLGRSPLSLTAELPDFSRRYVRFTLESPKLDLDPLIAAGAAASGAGSPGAAGSPPLAQPAKPAEQARPLLPPQAASRPGALPTPSPHPAYRPGTRRVPGGTRAVGGHPAPPQGGGASNSPPDLASTRRAGVSDGTPAAQRQARSGPGGDARALGASVAGLSADGTLKVAQGTLKGVQFTDLRGELKLRDRVFTLERLTVGLYSGEYAGSGTADLRGKIPALDFTSKLDRVKANDILSETTSIKGIVFGLLSANLRLKGQGLDAESLLASLAGEGKFSLTDGRIASFDMLDRLEALVALARGGQPPTVAADAGGGPKGTVVKSLSSTVRVEKGKFITPDLSLSAGEFGLTGSGAVGFDQSLAYELKATLPAPLARQVLGRDVARLLAAEASGAVQIPFRMGGTLAAPTFSLSGKFFQEQLRSRLEQAAGERLQQRLEQLLRGRGGAAPGDTTSEGAAPGASPTPAPVDPKQLLKDLLK